MVQHLSGKTEWNWELRNKSAGCVEKCSCWKKRKVAHGCSKEEFYKCCQGDRPKEHTVPVSKKHLPILEFSWPGHAFNLCIGASGVGGLQSTEQLVFMTLLHLGVGIAIHAAKDLRTTTLMESHAVRKDVLSAGRTQMMQLPVLKGANSAKGYGDAPYSLNLKHMMFLIS